MTESVLNKVTRFHSIHTYAVYWALPKIAWTSEDYGRGEKC